MNIQKYLMLDLSVYDKASTYIGNTELKTTVLGMLFMSKAGMGSSSELITIGQRYESAQNSRDALQDKMDKYSADIANETAKVFTSEVGEIYNINNVHVVDEAEETKTPSNINHKKDIIMFGAIGLVIAFAYVIIANMLDTTVKTEDDVERLVSLPVLASIPMYDPSEIKKSKRGGRRKR